MLFGSEYLEGLKVKGPLGNLVLDPAFDMIDCVVVLFYSNGLCHYAERP